MQRIDKVISNQMCVSRSDARRLIKIGKVYLNGERVKAFDEKVDENSDITVNGEPLRFADKVYIMMNKAQDIVCDDKGDFPYAPDVLPDDLKRKDLFCVGRLDKDTTGLLLITNDGEFAHNVISPKKHIEKCYRATLAEAIKYEDIVKAKSGMVLSDGTRLMPAEIVASDDCKTVDFIISEGKYHQIKRMAGAMNNKIETLHRKRIGNLTLDEDLNFGQAKEISKEEAEKVFNSTTLYF